ncbi:histidine phosphatase family protein [Demequina sp. NBRC 110053]|uniref:SixA phosphatase family protein n=1 Tax=Demequina sp. NBRC 110053 TaxID=1570342 RepID=UPI0013564949|nr:histidine phosphatase family protein [Demequina sp. NBRC 110053]
MPTLIIARHAKAEAPAPGLQDMERTLALIGRKASTKLGQELAAASLAPQVALVSPATRTQQTWKLMSAALEGVDTRTVDGLYETDVEGLLSVARELEDVEVAVMVGHEPTSSAAAAYVAGPGSSTDALKSIAQGLSTGTAAVLEFDGPWDSLGSRTARLTAVISGRDVE